VTQVFVDLDGTLADFNTGYEMAFGIRPDKEADDVDWAKVASVPGFYADLPLMPDAKRLWNFLSLYLEKKPIILTGVPKSIPEAGADKRVMVTRNFGAETTMLWCPSAEKCKHAQPGDILIDDWRKYQHLWLAAGGRWITHTSAEDSIRQLLEMDADGQAVKPFPQSYYEGVPTIYSFPRA
jgi:hypothetical protein